MEMPETKKKEESKIVKLTEPIKGDDVFSLVAKDMGEPSFAMVRRFKLQGDDEHVFVAKDIQDVLKINMHYKRDGDYEWGKEKIMVPVVTATNGTRKVLALTELGLERALYRSDTPMAQKFRLFVHVVLKRLFRTGSVTMQQATTDFKAEADKWKKKYELENEACEQLYEKCQKLEGRNERQMLQLQDAAEENELMQKRQSVNDEKDTSSDEFILQKTKEKYCKPVFIMLMKPPKEVEGEYDYDHESEPTPDDIYIFGLQAKEESKTRQCVCKVFINKDQTLDQLHEELKKRFLQLKKKDGTPFANMYETSISELKNVADEMFKSGIIAEKL